ncbi:uncharacterized protein LOC122956330 [Acropora millepora]|uniref:uncharacterized protein LOC122956330 n=1 Tax=Acropora millepora TaxID=45264 RepID=UPI001CF41867|nr:uncharacterized protein LOC122956330 [Acropora millepora]
MQQALANMKKPFMKQLPPLMLQLSPKELHESLRQLRVYKQLSHEDLNTLETCQLLSEHEQALKSAQNYQDCFFKINSRMSTADGLSEQEFSSMACGLARVVLP